LPCSQEPATSPHPQPHQYIPRQHRIYSTVILRLSSHLRLQLQSCLRLSYFAHQNPVCIPPVSHSCPVHLTSTSKLHLGHGELILPRSQSITPLNVTIYFVLGTFRAKIPARRTAILIQISCSFSVPSNSKIGSPSN
jgi:hypothetical protein